MRTDGNDSNDGSANDASHALLTIQRAVDLISALDCQSYDVTIQVGDGTYATPVTIGPMLGSGIFKITGTAASPPGVIVSTTSASCFTFLGCLQKSTFVVANLEVRTSGSSGDGVAVSNASLVGLDNVTFGTCVGNHINCARQSQVVLQTNYTVSGGAQTHYRATLNGLISRSGALTSVANSSSPQFSIAYAQASQGGIISIPIPVTYSGTPSGQRYNSDLNGVIYTNGGGASFFPGTTAGATATGGQYA